MRRLVTAVVLVALVAPMALAQTALGRAQQEAAVSRQRAVAKVREQLDGVDGLIAARRFADVEMRLQMSRRVVRTNEHLTDTERAELVTRLDELRARVDAAKDAYVAERDARQGQEIARRETERRMAEAMFAERRHKSHWAKLDAYRETRQYDKAVEEAKAVLRTRPNDHAARDAMWDMQYLSDVQKRRGIRQHRSYEAAMSLLSTEDSATAWSELHRYPDPDKWEKLTQRRLSRMAREMMGQTREGERTEMQLQQRLDLNVDAVSLSGVVAYLSEASGVPIAIDPHLEDDTGIDPDSHVVSVNVRQLTLEQLLNMVLPSDTGILRQDGHLILTSREKANPLVTMTYPIEHLVAEIPDFGKTAPTLSLSSALDQGQGGGGGGGIWGNDPTVADDTGEPHVRIIELIERFVRSTDPRVADWESMGGQATIDYFNGTLIISQTETGHRKVVALLARL